MTSEAAGEPSAENSERSAQWGTPYKPGQSGNPAGRPRSTMNALIRDKTLDGETLVEQAISLLKGEEVNGIKPSPELSFRALEWLADRGWGKATLNVEHGGTITHAIGLFADVPTEDLLALIGMAKAIRAREAGVIEGEARMLEADEDVSSSQ